MDVPCGLTLVINLSSICIITTFSTHPTIPETLHLLRPHQTITYNHFCPDNKANIIIVESAPRMFRFLSSSIFNNITFYIKLALLSKRLDPIEMPMIFYFLDFIKFLQPSSWNNNSLYYCVIYPMIFNSHAISTAYHKNLTLYCWNHSVQCFSCKYSYSRIFTLLNIFMRIIISILGTIHNCQDAL